MATDKSLKGALKRWVPRLLDAQRDNLNEADTVARIAKVLEEVLGYDPLVEITREAQMKGKFVDLAVKVDGVIRFLLEAKAAGVTLRDRHIEQAEGYAARNNFQWVVLTNGVVWNLYHLTFDQGIEDERVFSVDVSANSLEEVAEKLSLINRDSIRKRQHEKYWEHQSALSARVVGKYLFHEDVLSKIRREIRRELGFLVDPEDLSAAIHGMLSPETRESMGPIRRRKMANPGSAKGPRVKGRKEPAKPGAKTLTVGSVLERAYKGKQHVVCVLEDGLEYGGQKYDSLTAVAKVITGYTSISGPEFFGLVEKSTPTAPETEV